MNSETRTAKPSIVPVGMPARTEGASALARLGRKLMFGQFERIRDGELRVRGKGGHERLVPVGRVASEALRAYVDGDRLAVLRRWDPRERALFVGRLGGRLPARAVSAMFRRWQAGMTPHQLRHACATHMLRNGASIVVLKELLGHKGIATTRIYTEVKVEDVRKGLEKYHPRG